MISFYLVSPENRWCIKPEITRTDNWKISTIFRPICLYKGYKLVRFKLYTFEILEVKISKFGLHHQVRHVKWVRKSQKWNHVSSHDCIVSISEPFKWRIWRCSTNFKILIFQIFHHPKSHKTVWICLKSSKKSLQAISGHNLFPTKVQFRSKIILSRKWTFQEIKL